MSHFERNIRQKYSINIEVSYNDSSRYFIEFEDNICINNEIFYFKSY